MGWQLSFTAELLMVTFIRSSFKVNVVSRPHQILVIQVAGPCGQIRPGQLTTAECSCAAAGEMNNSGGTGVRLGRCARFPPASLTNAPLTRSW